MASAVPRQGFARILPSGRAIRYLKPSLPDYTKASEGIKPGDLDALVWALLPRIVTGITLAPVAEIQGPEEEIPIPPEVLAAAAAAGEDPPEPTKVRFLDEVAMVKSVDEGAGGGWHDVNWLSLREKDKATGATLLEKLFNDEIADFMDMKASVVQMIFGGKKELPPPMRRTPIKTT